MHHEMLIKTHARTVLGRLSRGTLDDSKARFRALLIGECPNPKVIPVEFWSTAAAFDNTLRGSGRWLEERLTHPALNDWRIDLENAVTLERSQHRLHKYDAIIALSRFVSEAYELPYIPHPAYWKRFHSHHPERWVYLLLRELRRQACPKQ